MARKNTSEEHYSEVQEAGYIRDVAAGASTTLTAAVAKGASTFEVASATGITAGDLLRINGGDKLEEVVVDSVAANVVTPRDVLAYAHPAGAAVVEREKVDTGDVTDQGVRSATSENANVINAATRPGASWKRSIVSAEHTLSWALLSYSIENIAIAHGIPESQITGGTGNKPQRLVVGYRSLGTLRNVSVYFRGMRDDGTPVEVQGWGADFSANGEVTYNSGTGAPLPLSASCAAKVYYEG